MQNRPIFNLELQRQHMTREITYQRGEEQRTAVVERTGDAFSVRVGATMLMTT